MMEGADGVTGEHDEAESSRPEPEGEREPEDQSTDSPRAVGTERSAWMTSATTWRSGTGVRALT